MGRPASFGNWLIETGRQILANLADLLFDEVIVIQQPFGGRRDRRRPSPTAAPIAR